MEGILIAAALILVVLGLVGAVIYLVFRPDAMSAKAQVKADRRRIAKRDRDIDAYMAAEAELDARR